MVAVAVLLVVILAIGKIFGTTSQVTSIGAGTNDLLQAAAAIERQVRKDFERLSYEGVFAIQGHLVRNDINGGLLNPNLPPDAGIRADQLLFFTQGLGSIQTFRVADESRHRAQSTTARVYYGHAFQLGQNTLQTRAFGEIQPNTAQDAAQRIEPWYVGVADMQTTRFTTVTQGNVFQAGSTNSIDATQPEARRWLLSRQAVQLGDDDTTAPGSDSKTFYLEGLTARSVFLSDPLSGVQSPQLLQGRVDAAATHLNEIRSAITGSGANNWATQRNVIYDQLVFFP
ncbi:MAG: hypothetical protein ACYTGC_20405, partial [Planctomycetota bacterium]